MLFLPENLSLSSLVRDITPFTSFNKYILSMFLPITSHILFHTFNYLCVHLIFLICLLGLGTLGDAYFYFLASIYWLAQKM